MNYGNMIVYLLAGLGAFMIGFKILSDNTKLMADSGLRRMFKKSDTNAFVGVGIGTVCTMVLQSSSATTVMVVGFVNAGVMGLYQATAVIMGANIGTTVTAQIAALGTFDFIKYAMVLACVGIFINLFSKNEKVKIISYGLAGLGLLFMGLKYMSTAMVEVKDSAVILSALQKINNPFLLLAIGAVFTGIVQSSSATTAIIISMTSAGLMIGNGGNAVLYVILGTNIGTCVTALLSSIGASTNAKRAAMVHLLFNVFGSALFMIVLLSWPSFMDMTIAKWFRVAPTQIAMFHTFFNVIITILFLPFIRGFVKLVEIIIPDKQKGKSEGVTSFIDERLIPMPSFAIVQAEKEVNRTASLAIESLDKALQGFCNRVDESDFVEKNNKKIRDIQTVIDNYTVKLSANEKMTYANELSVAQLQHALVDINRIGELAENIARYTKNVIEKELVFSENVIIDLQAMMARIKTLFENSMLVYVGKQKDKVKLVDSIEDEVDACKKKLIDDHIQRVREGICQATSSSTFINLVSNLERAGDHLYLIAHCAD